MRVPRWEGLRPIHLLPSLSSLELFLFKRQHALWQVLGARQGTVGDQPFPGATSGSPPHWGESEPGKSAAGGTDGATAKGEEISQGEGAKSKVC